MPEWIRQPSQRHYPNLQQHFTWANDPGSGFMFDVDERTRQVVLSNDHARANYERARAETAAGRMLDQGIQDFGVEEYDPGAIRCGCGRTVELISDWQGTRCDCGNEYGSQGELFRANWREFCRETGELTDEDFL